MKHLLVLLVLISCLSGCMEPEVADQAQPEAALVEASVETESSQPILEFVWHKKGLEFSNEGLDQAVVKWNSLIDESEHQMQFANILMAEQPNENMDFMWAMLWQSQGAREAGWSDWRENLAPRWAEMTDGLLTYSEEHIYSFAPSVQRERSEDSGNKSYEARFDFCTFNDGFDSEALASFQSEYHAWLDAYEKDNGTTGYWYVDLVPQFESEIEPDFVWLHLWKDTAEMTAGIEDFEQSPLAVKVTAMSTCENYSFGGQRIRG